ncbi:uroporphyrinogen-III C-methyltransferase, partial [Methylogaea oryzae]|uniref:uroporphyrinogen-III C-methyltransferase n=1 Tax=Methylogaea oryzae TaxID=1295382 RepID=UPI0006D17996
ARRLVEYAEVYRRVRPKTDAGPLLDRWRQGEVHGVVVTSGEALSNLTAMVGFEGVALLRKTPLVTVSERVRQQALVLGVRQVASAEGAADAALVQALAELLSDRVNEQLQARGPGTVTDQDKQPKPAELSAGVSLGSAAPVAENSPPAAKIKPVKTKPARRAWIGYVILLLVVGIVVGGYFLMQQIRSTQEGLGGELSKEDREIAELNTQVADLQAVFKTLHGQMATLETRLSTEDNKVERVLGEQSAQFSEKLEQFRGEVRDDLQVLHRMLGKTRSDWLVADAEYLLGAALQRLHLVGDVKTAIAALEGADERLRESGEPAVFKVREQLANEIRILKSFTPPDLIGASSRLLALEAKVRELPLLLPHAGKGVSSAGSPDGAHGAPKTAAPGEADSITDSLMGELGKYVSIRRLDKPVASVLTPEETLVLRQILLLKLETARMALVRGDDALYKASLETARLWLAENFDDGQAAVRSVDGDIRALMEQPIQVAYPEIGKALAMLRDITKLRVEADGVVADKEKKPRQGRE